MDTPNSERDVRRDIQRSDEYKGLLEALKERVARAQLAALRAVNRELIGLYRDIGRTIVEKQEEVGWGENIVIMRRYYLT